MKPASDIRSGMAIRVQGSAYRVLHAEYHAGGGKMHGTVHAKLEKLESGHLTERRFRPEERFEELELERQAMEYLYDDGDQCVVMHPETYEQIGIPRTSFGSFARYLQPNREVEVEFLEGEPFQVRPPATIELEVRSTPAPIHLENSSVPKEAILDNGVEAHVPQFIKEGDVVRIEVETGKYLERVR
ncbi:MAG: elongation factor P [Thermoanaerobaculia bacterium]